jgi:hypothetical protein
LKAVSLVANSFNVIERGKTVKNKDRKTKRQEYRNAENKEI